MRDQIWRRVICAQRQVERPSAASRYVSPHSACPWYRRRWSDNDKGVRLVTEKATSDRIVLVRVGDKPTLASIRRDAPPARRDVWHHDLVGASPVEQPPCAVSFRGKIHRLPGRKCEQSTHCNLCAHKRAGVGGSEGFGRPPRTVADLARRQPAANLMHRNAGPGDDACYQRDGYAVPRFQRLSCPKAACAAARRAIGTR